MGKLHDLVGLSFDVELMSIFDAAGNRTDLKALVNSTADFWNGEKQRKNKGDSHKKWDVWVRWASFC